MQRVRGARLGLVRGLGWCRVAVSAGRRFVQGVGWRGATCSLGGEERMPHLVRGKSLEVVAVPAAGEYGEIEGPRCHQPEEPQHRAGDGLRGEGAEENLREGDRDERKQSSAVQLHAKLGTLTRVVLPAQPFQRSAFQAAHPPACASIYSHPSRRQLGYAPSQRGPPYASEGASSP